MLPPFRLGVGGPVAGGRQYVAWVHRDDLVGMMLAALRRRTLVGPGQRDGARTGEQPRVLASARARCCTVRRCCRCPELALRLLYGEMAEIVTTGVRAVPAKALVLGYGFEYPRLEDALRATLA